MRKEIINYKIADDHNLSGEVKVNLAEDLENTVKNILTNPFELNKKKYLGVDFFHIIREYNGNEIKIFLDPKIKEFEKIANDDSYLKKEFSSTFKLKIANFLEKFLAPEEKFRVREFKIKGLAAIDADQTLSYYIKLAEKAFLSYAENPVNPQSKSVKI